MNNSGGSGVFNAANGGGGGALETYVGELKCGDFYTDLPDTQQSAWTLDPSNYSASDVMRFNFTVLGSRVHMITSRGGAFRAVSRFAQFNLRYALNAANVPTTLWPRYTPVSPVGGTIEIMEFCPDFVPVTVDGANSVGQCAIIDQNGAGLPPPYDELLTGPLIFFVPTILATTYDTSFNFTTEFRDKIVKFPAMEASWSIRN